MEFSVATKEERETMRKAIARNGWIGPSLESVLTAYDEDGKFTIALMFLGGDIANDKTARIYVGVAKRMTYAGDGQNDEHDPKIGRTIALSRAVKGQPVEIPWLEKEDSR